MPADFDKAALGEVDVGSKEAAEVSLANAFWLRWMHLREQVMLLHPTHAHAPGVQLLCSIIHASTDFVGDVVQCAAFAAWPDSELHERWLGHGVHPGTACSLLLLAFTSTNHQQTLSLQALGADRHPKSPGRLPGLHMPQLWCQQHPLASMKDSVASIAVLHWQAWVAVAVQLAAVLNFAYLQIPEEQRESYAKGQHLRGADAVNADRARAEIVSRRCLAAHKHIK